MTRIALMPSAYLPSLGGVEELTRNLAVTLKARGHQVEIWSNTNDAAERPRTEILDGLTVRRFRLPMPTARPTTYVPAIIGSATTLREMRRAAGEFDPEVLHVQCFGPNGIYATALSMLSRTPLMVSLQGETRMDDSDIFDNSILFRLGLRAGLRRAAVTTACSRFTLNDAHERFGLPRDAGRVVFNGVDLKNSARADSSPEGRPSRHYVLAVGRTVRKKGFDLLIEAWSKIAKRHPSTALVIAGRGSELESLIQRANDLGIADQVEFLGRASREQVAQLMAGASCFVMPSRLEPFGIVILEAWRASTAVICSRIGGPPEFVTDEETGLLVDPNRIDELGSALERVLSDPELRARLSEAGNQAVARFDWPVIATEYERLYEQVIEPGA